MFMWQKHLFLHRMSDKIVACYRSLYIFFLLSPSIKHKYIERIELIRMTVSSSQSSIYGNEFIWFVCFFFCLFCWGRAHANAFNNIGSTLSYCVCGGAILTNIYNLCFIGLFYREIKVHVHKSRAIDRLHIATQYIYILLNPATQWFVCGSKWNIEGISYMLYVIY